MSGSRSPFSSILHRLRWLQCPTAAMVALLQRTPVLRMAASLGDAFAGTGTGSAATALVRSAAAFAALGAIDTMAGATTLVAKTTVSPWSGTTGVSIPTVAFGVNGTAGPPGSWTIKSTLPPGLTFGGLTGPGTVNVANPTLQGTPTTAGTYYLDLVAYFYPNGAATSGNLASPDFLYAVKIAQGAPPVPTIVTGPSVQTVAPGSTVVFNFGATGTGTLAYQWSINGAAISGATSARLVTVAPPGTGTSTYSCAVTNTVSGATSAAATASAQLTVQASATPGHLINESVLTAIPTGGTLTVGFTTSAASERLLIRGVGPSLANFGLTTFVLDPAIEVVPAGSAAGAPGNAKNDNWGSDAANINAADSATGAFPLIAGSLDAALITTPTVAGNSVVYSPNTTGGQGLAEIWDYSAAAYTVSSPRIINLSTLLNVTNGAGLSAGFIVGGNTNKTFLVRAMGPSLAKAFGLGGTMTDPQLSLVVQSTAQPIASNTNWSGDAQINAVANQVTQFPFASVPALADSAVLVTLAPGSYTATATSASGGGGLVLIEVYEVP